MSYKKVMTKRPERSIYSGAFWRKLQKIVNFSHRNQTSTIFKRFRVPKTSLSVTVTSIFNYYELYKIIYFLQNL